MAKLNYKKMKTLAVVLFAVLLIVFALSGCETNPVIGQTDNIAQTVKTTNQTIMVVDNYESRIFRYEKIFSDGVFLNITFPECDTNGCGISIEIKSIIYYETFK